MRYVVLVCSVMLSACGSSIDAGEYEVSGRLEHNSCNSPGAEVTEAVWVITESGDGYVLTSPGSAIEIAGREDGDGLVFSTSDAVDSGGCVGTQSVKARLKPSPSGFSGTLTLSFDYDCGEQGTVDCEVRYRISGERVGQ